MIHVLNYKFNLLKDSNRGMRSAHCVENKFDPLYTVPKSIESQHKTEPIIGFDYIYVHSTGLLHISCGDSDYFGDSEFCFVVGQLNCKKS